jgi:hypothetical protein
MSLLRTEDEIRAAGAQAVSGWQIPDEVIDRLVVLIGPVAADVQAAQPESKPAADAA